MRFPRLPHLPIFASICLCLAVPTVADAEILLLDLLSRQRTDAFASESVDSAFMEQQTSVVYSLSMLDGNDLVSIEWGTVTGTPNNANVAYAINAGGGDDTLRFYNALVGGETPFSQGRTPDITSGAGNDVIDIQGGVFLGSIFGGSGDDRMELYNRSYLDANDVQHRGPIVYGRLSGGSGDDTILARDDTYVDGSRFIYSNGEAEWIGAYLDGGNDRFSLYGGISDAVDERGAVMHGSIVGGEGNDIIKVYDYAIVYGNVNGRIFQNQVDSIPDKLGNDEIYLSGNATVYGNVEGGWGSDIISVLDNAEVAAYTTVEGSTLAGNVWGEQGDDVIIIGGSAKIAGTVDGGENVDTLILEGRDVNATAINANSFERVIKRGGGEWTLRFPSPTNGNPVTLIDLRVLRAGGKLTIETSAGPPKADLRVTNQILIYEDAILHVKTNLDANYIFIAPTGQLIVTASPENLTVNTLESYGDVTVSGTVNAVNLSFYSGTADLQGAVTTGTYTQSGGDVTVGGAFVSQQTLTPAGYVTGGNAVITGGTFEAQAGATVDGAFTVGRTAQVTVDGADLTAANVNVTGGPNGSVAQGYALTAKQNIVADNVTVSGGSLKAEGTITAADTVRVSGGLLTAEQTTAAKDVVVSGGTYTAQGNVTATDTLRVSGGTMNAEANVAAADLTVSGGTFNTQGNVTASNSMTFSGGTTNVVASGAYGNTGGPIAVTGGTINVNASQTLTLGSTLNMTSGAFNVLDNATLNASPISVTNSVLSMNTGATVNAADVTVNSGGIIGGSGTLDGGGAGSALGVKSGGTLIGTGAGMTVNEYDQITLEAGSRTIGKITFQSTVGGAMMTVDAGAVLGGNLDIQMPITVNGGQVSPGTSIGTQTVFSATGWNSPIITVEYGDGTNDQTIVDTGGLLVINNGTVRPAVDPNNPNFIVPSTGAQYDFVVGANTGVVGVTNPLQIDPTVQANTPVFTYGLAYNAGVGPAAYYRLTVARNTYESLVTSANQKVIGDTIDGVIASSAWTSDQAVVINNLDRLTSTQAIAAAFNQMSPEPYASLGLINLTVTDRFTDVALSHLTQLVEAADTFCDPCACGQSRHYTNGTYLWGHGIGAWDRYDGNADTLGWDSDFYGTVMGLDACYGDMFYGLSAGYASQTVNFNEVDAYSNNDYFNLNLYGGYESCGWFANGGAGFTYAWNHMHRRIRFGEINRTADGTPDTPIASGFLYGGRRYILGNCRLTPMIGVRAATGNVDGFSETGADSLNLVVSSYHRNSAVAEIGTRFSWFIQQNLRLDLQGFYSYEGGDDISFVTARYMGSNLEVAGAEIERSACRLGAAITGDLGSRTSIYARYDGVIRERYNVHGGSIGLSIKF